MEERFGVKKTRNARRIVNLVFRAQQSSYKYPAFGTIPRYSTRRCTVHRDDTSSGRGRKRRERNVLSRQREIENGKRAGQTSTRAFRWQVSACFDVVVIYERRTGTFSSASLPTRFYASAENSVYPCCEYQLFPMTLMTGEEQASTAFQS